MESTILIASHLAFLVIGALITGWCAWLFRVDSANAGAAREQAGRRLALLEEVALQTGALHELFESFTALTLSGAPAASGEARQQWDKRNQQLIAALEDIPLAEARLRLLEEVALAKVLRLYTGKISALRRQCASGRRTVSEETLKQPVTDINSLRDTFFESLARRYGRKTV